MSKIFFTFGTQCGLRALMLPWFDLLYGCYIYCFLVYIVSFPTYLFFFTFVTYLLSYLSFPLRIDPLCFQVGFHKRRLNLTLVFVFISCCNTFLQIDECMLLLCSSLHFSIPSQGLGNRLWNDLLCVEWDIKPQLSQIKSILTFVMSNLAYGAWLRSLVWRSKSKKTVSW